MSKMFRFKTSFLLQATTVAAFCCLPMALNKESGFVWTAFLLPIGLAVLASTQVESHGPFEFRFKELPNSVVEYSATGGRQAQWLSKWRIIGAGLCLSIVFGFPALHIVDPEPPAFWGSIVAVYALGAIMLVGLSTRRRVLTKERQFVTDYLLFGRRWWRRRWQVLEGDRLAVRPTCRAQGAAAPQSPFRRALFVSRWRQRQMVGLAVYGMDRVDADLDVAAGRIAKLVGIPYAGRHK